MKHGIDEQPEWVVQARSILNDEWFTLSESWYDDPIRNEWATPYKMAGRRDISRLHNMNPRTISECIARVQWRQEWNTIRLLNTQSGDTIPWEVFG